MVDPPFCLYTSFPRAAISGGTDFVNVEPGSLISVEKSGDYDPVQLYGEPQVFFYQLYGRSGC